MKCINCGAEVGLLDKTCPYCGSVNLESAGHRAEMKKYQKRSEKTKSAVKKSIAENVPLVVSAVILVLLIIGIGVAFYVEDEAALFSHWANRRESLKKSEEFSEKLIEYLEVGDYTGFVAYKEYHVIPEYEPEFQEFEKLSNFAYEFSQTMNSIERAVMYGEDAPRYGQESNVSSCRRNIDMFYYEYGKLENEPEDKYQKYMIDMKEQMDTALTIYLGLDDQEREEFLGSSMNKQEVYLEEVLLGE